ncbi:hypothetical protein ACFYM2_21760 [Streptomyces sp. NPDC006711]|uniref:hypothetical protein n=1 Tax=unclassified Streptomyces TaxID=2593676 RepID=UPI0036CFFF09
MRAPALAVTAGLCLAAATDRTAAMGTDAAPGRFPRTVRYATGATDIKATPTSRAPRTRRDEAGAGRGGDAAGAAKRV